MSHTYVHHTLPLPPRGLPHSSTTVTIVLFSINSVKH